MVSGATSIHPSRHPLTYVPRVRPSRFSLSPPPPGGSTPSPQADVKTGFSQKTEEMEGRHVIEESMKLTNRERLSSMPTISPARTSTSASPRIKHGMPSPQRWLKTAHSSPKPIPSKARTSLPSPPFLFSKYYPYTQHSSHHGIIFAIVQAAFFFVVKKKKTYWLTLFNWTTR